MWFVGFDQYVAGELTLVGGITAFVGRTIVCLYFKFREKFREFL